MAILKTVTLIIISCTLVPVTHAQTADSTRKARVEKSVFGIQVGLVGVWAYTELRLTDRIALRGEAGGITIIRHVDLRNDNVSRNQNQSMGLFVPFATVESRWYYKIGYHKNPVKRVWRESAIQSELRDVTDNSGNFLSMQVSYRHSPPAFPWDLLSNTYYPRDSKAKTIAIMAFWGRRRTLDRDFNYEMNVGVGSQYVFDGTEFYGDKKKPIWMVSIRVQLSIGYRFHFKKNTPQKRKNRR